MDDGYPRISEIEKMPLTQLNRWLTKYGIPRRINPTRSSLCKAAKTSPWCALRPCPIGSELSFKHRCQLDLDECVCAITSQSCSSGHRRPWACQGLSEIDMHIPGVKADVASWKLNGDIRSLAVKHTNRFDDSHAFQWIFSIIGQW